jgi:hypothetical protein
MKENKQLFTIQDLADGKCAIEYDVENGDLELLKKVLSKAGQKDIKNVYGTFKYYSVGNYYWYGLNEPHDTPTQPLHLFNLEENEQPQQTQGKLYRWVKASERLPEKKTNCIENDKPIIFANTKKATVMYVMQSITPNIPALLQNDLNGWDGTRGFKILKHNNNELTY